MGVRKVDEGVDPRREADVAEGDANPAREEGRRRRAGFTWLWVVVGGGGGASEREGEKVRVCVNVCESEARARTLCPPLKDARVDDMRHLPREIVIVRRHEVIAWIVDPPRVVRVA